MGPSAPTNLSLIYRSVATTRSEFKPKANRRMGTCTSDGMAAPAWVRHVRNYLTVR
jgi:hypothetical protein